MKNQAAHKVAAKNGRTSAQVALNRLVRQGVAAIPKVTGEVNLRENLDVFGFGLDGDDLKALLGV